MSSRWYTSQIGSTQRKTHRILIAVLALLAPGGATLASTLPLPKTLATEALSESAPSAFAPADFQAEDYAVTWDGVAPAGFHATIEPGSLQWVRVSELLVVPRARLLIEGGPGAVTCGGFTQALPAHIPVALISDPANQCSVTSRGAVHRLQVQFHPRRAQNGLRAYIDSSCSHYSVSVEGAPARSDWLYLGCRMVSAMSADHRTSSLEVYVFWDGVGQSIEIGGAATPASAVSVWPLRLAPNASVVRLKAGNREILLHYAIPENLHHGGVAAGLGPYSFNYESTTFSEHTAAPILTLYGGYAIQDSMRIVAFDATAFNTTLYTDFGVYLSTEYAQIFDRRIILNLMLGAHAIGFRSQGTYYVQPGVPQGMEAVVTDAFVRAADLRAGAFVYPNINGKEYYNAWLRWGQRSYFVELNYISWQENLNEKGLFYSRSLGLSVGLPLFQFL